MKETLKTRPAKRRNLPKAPTGIQGFDEITHGGLPKGRPTLVCGGAGCGKTIFALEFLVRGATQFGERGVFMCFEETADDIAKNVASIGFDLEKLQRDKLISLDYVRVERAEIEEIGDYDLEGLFVRLGHAIDATKAKRVVLDTLEALFSGFTNATILRAEIRRLFAWLKAKGVTTVLTGEKGDRELTRHGLEEYVSDCVVLLDHRIVNQISTRRIRIVKYRGSPHGTNEYPFLIDNDGMNVMPVTSVEMNHEVSHERVLSGLAPLDAMLGGNGFYRGSSVLITGPPGTGKTTLTSTYLDAACRRGERCMFFGFEESRQQIIRNMSSVGLALQRWIDRGLLEIHCARPTLHGLETHLAILHRKVDLFKPSMIVADPISALITAGNQGDVTAMLMRLIDFLKTRLITFFMTSLVSEGRTVEESEVNISSLIDVWFLQQNVTVGGERNHTLYVIKARGIPHSNQFREYTITPNGIRLSEPYLGTDGVLTGSARLSQEAREKADMILRHQDIARREADLERKRKAMEAQVENLRSEFAAEEAALKTFVSQEGARARLLSEDRAAMATSRRLDLSSPKTPSRKARNE